MAIDHSRENNVHALPGAAPAREAPSSKQRKGAGLSRRRIAALALIPLLAIAAAGAWYKFHPKANPAARFVTATVAQGDIEDTVTALGNLQPKTYVDVGAQVSGQLMKIDVAVGQKVKQGDLLAEIDPTLAEAKVTADEAALANLQAQLVDKRAQLDLAQKQLGRQQSMMKDNATSEDALQIALTTVRSNKAQIAALEAQAKEAQSSLAADQASLGYTKIYAPMTGTVVSLTAQQGQTLNATQTAPVILRIADLATMTVWTQVSEADVPRLKLGMGAYFTTLGDQSLKWQGKLLQIQPTPDVVNNVVLYPALFDVANPDGTLMTQMSAQVFFVVAAVKNAVTVPVAALHRPGSHAAKGDADPDMVDPGAGATGDDPLGAASSNGDDAKPYFVRVLDGSGHATRRQVWIGVSNRVSAEVLNGLAPGEVVVLGRQSGGETAEAAANGSKGGRSGIGRLFLTKPIGLQTALGQPLFELEGITKVYNPDSEQRVEVLHGVSLKIHRGEFVAIMGASGSGKTTLMNILGCLDKPTGGRYLLSGTDVAGLDRGDLAWLRRSVFGFVFQSYNLIGTATAQENVEIPAIYAGLAGAERHQRAAELLGMLGLSERTTHRPNQLSGGQQQRVSIARALMNGGTAILADEPTGALDSKSGAEVLEFLEHLADDGHTVIIITHDADVARHARRRIEIKDGNIVADVIQSFSDKARSEPQPADRPVKALDFVDHTQRLDELFETLRMALRALRVNMLRTILTLLGIVIGVGSVVAMLAVGDGARQVVLDRIGSMGTDLLLIRPGAPNQRGAGNAIATLVPQDAEAISSLANVRAAVPELSASVTVRFGDSDYQTAATGTTADLTQIRAWPVAQGSFFTRDDAARYAAVTVLGQTVVSNLFPAGTNPVGHFVLINNVPFQVLGVMSPKGATASGADLDDVVFVPLSTGSLRLFGQRNVKTITVAVDNVDKIDATQTSVTALLAERHKAEDFQIRNMAAVLQAAEDTQNTLAVLLGSVGAISLLVGGIGVMNIMLVSVTERTREIGIRMATGARMRNILQQFLTEAVVVSIFGGVLGIGCGFAMAAGFSQFGVPVQVSLAVVGLAFACAVAVGLIFGFAPALKAARLDPVQALASE